MSGPSRPPTPPGRLPALGHTVPFLRGPLQALQEWGGTADVVRVTVAGQQFCLVSAPELVGQVLTADDYRKAELVRERLGTLQGGSLVLLEGAEWRERRRLLRQGFTEHQAAGSLTTRYATATVEEWPTDVRADEEMQSLSLAILARALFGLDLHGEETPIHQAADDILARLNPRTLSAFLPEWVPTPTNYRFRQAVATLHERIDTVVSAANDTQHPENLLSVMLAAGLEPARIRDELIALLFAGYDSTATALTLSLGLLGDHPDAQYKLRRELESSFDGKKPTAADLETLTYLDAVVRESLRLYPPQYAVFREPTHDVTLGGNRIDAGRTVVLSPWVCQRDSTHWEDPEQFRPERWRSDRDRPDFSYFPYGGGPRSCLGGGLADQTIRLVLAVVCQRRQLKLAGDLSVAPGPTLSPGAVELRTFPDHV